MLVLSRRPNEKILFTNIGVSVQIIETRGNTVRVGIEAPKNIRILREELAEPADFESASQLAISNQSDSSSFEDQRRTSIRETIDEISLAIALAQNQQRQGLRDDVDIALDQAIERLQDLKDRIPSNNQTGDNAIVCETVSSYCVDKNRTELMIGDGFDSSIRPSFRLDFESADLTATF